VAGQPQTRRYTITPNCPKGADGGDAQFEQRLEPDPKSTDLIAAFGRAARINRLLKKSAMRNGFLLAQPAAFGFGSFGADGMRG
jgi:hypothetical protein